MRAAMLGGAGYMAGKRMQQGSQRESDQEARIEALEQQGATAPAASAEAAPALAQPAAGGQAVDVVDKLKELADLHSAGAIDDGEFAAAKQRLLGS